MDGSTAERESLGNSEAIRHLKGALEQGRDWVPALLESMAMWTIAEEVHDDRHNRYLLGGEAFDWLVLAERLLAEVDGLVPEKEKSQLLSSGEFPRTLGEDELRGLLGPEKYSAYLNYWYGVVVEQAVMRSAEEEEQKRLPMRGTRARREAAERAFRRVYGEGREELHRRFRGERGYGEAASVTATEAKEFTYWLFKHRLITGEGERVASDTRKGLLFLNRNRDRG